MITMRLVLLISIALSMLSCNTSEPSFYIYKENDMEIPPGLNILETHFFVTSNIENTFRKEIESRSILPEQILSVSPGQGTFEPIFNEFDYGIIEEVSIWLVSYTEPNLRKEIYYRDQIPFSQRNELRLLSGIANLKDFLLAVDRYNLEIQIKFRNFVPAKIDNRFTYSFAIFTE